MAGAPLAGLLVQTRFPSSPPCWTVASSAASHWVACVCGIVMLWRRSPVAAFGLAFLALTFSIVSNFFITIGTICAERLMYLPSAGALIAAGVGAGRLATIVPSRRYVASAVLAVLVVTGAVRTWTRNRDWANDFTLWSAAIEVAPASARVHRRTAGS